MVSLSRHPLTPSETKTFVEMLGRHRSELVRYHMQLPLRSPARAAIKTLLDQQSEIATIITGETDYFSGKPHSMNVAPPGRR